VSWIGPDERWPAHSRSYFQAALQHARQAGWSFREASGHGFGTVTCDPDRPRDARCEYPVFSTGRAGESAANELRSIVDRCPHRNPKEARRDAVELANELLDEADRLIEAAQHCIGAQNMRAAADELLQLAAASSQAADERLAESELFDRALELEDDSREEERAAASLADVAGYTAGERVEAEPMLVVAEERVSDASELGSAARGSVKERLRERLTSTRARIDNLRGLLS
jgi:hypothetical protein